MNKQELCAKLQEGAQILWESGAGSEELRERFAGQEETVRDFTAKVLFVGGFSAGKSALLNSFLGEEEILPENISPETAIATELAYDTAERVIRVADSGAEEVVSLADVRGLSAAGYQKYIYKLDRERLRALSELIPVDMPGFDSGVEAHNKALMGHIDEAAAYVFVIDLTRGTVGQSSLKFLSEIKGYSDSIAFVLTKADKVMRENAENIRESIAGVLEGILGEKPAILVTSSRDADAGEKIATLLRSFSVDRLLMRRHGGSVLLLLRQALSAMEAQLSALSLDSRDIELAIQRQARKKDDVSRALEHEKIQLHESFQNEVPDRILSDIEAALRNQLGALLDSARHGNDAFRSTVNQILRTVMMQSMQSHIDVQFDGYLQSLESIANDGAVDDVRTQVSTVFNGVDRLLTGVASFAKMKKYIKLYRYCATGLAITTSVIAPALELALVFLPDVIANYQETKLKDRIDQEVIPQLCAQLRPEIQAQVLRIEEERIAEIEERFEETMRAEMEALQSLQREKMEKETDFEKKQSVLTDGIQRMQALIQEIETAK